MKVAPRHLAPAGNLRRCLRALAFGATIAASLSAVAEDRQPHALLDGLTIRLVTPTEPEPKRLLRTPGAGELFYTTRPGGIFQIPLGDTAGPPRQVFSTADHGMDDIAGATFGPDGALYLVGNFRDRHTETTVARIRKGTQTPDGAMHWKTVAETVPYPLAGILDHLFNAVVVSPDNRYLYV